jgi:H+/Cl- antiporter ClcA
LILVSTLLTHLFGGSAGREGTAVQMGASLSDALAHFFKVTLKERKYLLLAGAGSGFGSAIGAPWAGVLFGMEMIRIGPFRIVALLECLIASWVAVLTTHLLKAPHTSFLHPVLPDFSMKLLGFVFFSGICFGLLSYFFNRATHFFELFLKKLFSQSKWRAFGGGFLLVLLFSWEGTYRFSGLGISVITESMKQISPWQDIFYKFVFTALTLAAGFKGGEFIPLVFMGSALGSFLTPFAGISDLEPAFLASLGFAAVFGAASNTPLACTVMAAELFGIQITPYAFLVCLVSYLFSGHHGIYKSQKREETKWQGLLRWVRWKGK